MPSRENILLRILAEAERAGRENIAFERWWLSKVCGNRTRLQFIDPTTHAAALGAWQRGRASAAHPQAAAAKPAQGPPAAAAAGKGPNTAGDTG